jgi:hypothetical protein
MVYNEPDYTIKDAQINSVKESYDYKILVHAIAFVDRITDNLKEGL